MSTDLRILLRGSDFAHGFEDWYQNVIESLTLDTNTSIFFCKAIYAFNVSDADHGKRQSSPQDIYRNEIIRILRILDEKNNATNFLASPDVVHALSLYAMNAAINTTTSITIQNLYDLSSELLQSIGYQLVAFSCQLHQDACPLDSLDINKPDRHTKMLRRLSRALLQPR